MNCEKKIEIQKIKNNKKSLISSINKLWESNREIQVYLWRNEVKRIKKIILKNLKFLVKVKKEFEKILKKRFV